MFTSTFWLLIVVDIIVASNSDSDHRNSLWKLRNWMGGGLLPVPQQLFNILYNSVCRSNGLQKFWNRCRMVVQWLYKSCTIEDEGKAVTSYVLCAPTLWRVRWAMCWLWWGDLQQFMVGIPCQSQVSQSLLRLCQLSLWFTSDKI